MEANPITGGSLVKISRWWSKVRYLLLSLGCFIKSLSEALAATCRPWLEPPAHLR
jgi:hypothetical protein